MTSPARPASAAAAPAALRRCAYTSVLNRLAVMEFRLIRRRIAGDLDQVAIGVAAVMRRHRAECTGLRDGSFGDRHTTGPQVCADVAGADFGDEAQVERAGSVD